jgi:hypothetical protein
MATTTKKLESDAAKSDVTRTGLWPALLEAQKAFTPIEKTKEGARGSKYAPLESVLRAVVPVLNEHGIVLTQPTYIDEGVVIVRTVLTCAETGETYSCEYPASPATAQHQQLGGGVTYARRYSLLAAIGVAAEDEDDDGATAGSAGGDYRGSGNGRGQPQRQQTVTVRASAQPFIDAANAHIRSGVNLADCEDFYEEITNRPNYAKLNEAERTAIEKTINDMRRVLSDD